MTPSRHFLFDFSIKAETRQEVWQQSLLMLDYGTGEMFRGVS
jgi:hypothetical protein